MRFSSIVEFVTAIPKLIIAILLVLQIVFLPIYGIGLLVQGKLLGLPLFFFGGLLFIGFFGRIFGDILRERRQFERQREERERVEEQKQARLRWEQSPEGQAFLREKQLQEKAEQERAAAEKARIVEERRRQAVEDAKRRKQEEERIARSRWREFHERKTLAEIDKMTGTDFEKFLCRLFMKLGYTDVKTTSVNDQGGDILCRKPGGVETVVQAKRWKASLGNSVVQEILGAMLHYACNEGMIVTNSRFTSAAKQLAAKDKRISLCDRDWLDVQVRNCFPVDIPEFNWEDFETIVRRAN